MAVTGSFSGAAAAAGIGSTGTGASISVVARDQRARREMPRGARSAGPPLGATRGAPRPAMEHEPGDDESHQAVQWEVRSLCSQKNYYHHDSVLFAIDCGPSMHKQSDGEQEPPLLTALRAALRLMEIKLVSAPKDYVGIVLWNTVRFLTNIGDVAHDVRDEARILAPLGRVRHFAAGQCARHVPAAPVDPMYVNTVLTLQHWQRILSIFTVTWCRSKRRCPWSTSLRMRCVC